MSKAAPDGRWLFDLFTEIGIIDQLASAEFQRVLGADLGQSEFSVLNHFIRVGDNKTPSRLARIFQVTKPSMTAIVAKLEAKGYVQVTPGKTDRRQKFVTITAAGREARDAAAARTAPMLTDLLSEIDADRLKALKPDLQYLREILDKRRNAKDGLE